MKKRLKITALVLVATILISGLVWYHVDQEGFTRFAGKIVTLGNGQQPVEPGDFALHMMDVGPGEAMLVTCGGEAMLVDAGEEDAGGLVLQYLAAAGVTHLKAVVATHAHSDHMGGMDEVLAGISYDGVYVGPTSLEDSWVAPPCYDNLMEQLAHDGKAPTTLKAGDRFLLGQATVQVLGPILPQYDVNDTSLVLKICYKSSSFLLTGDMGQEAEQQLVDARVDLQADLLKLGHHGSSGSTGELFLKQVNPTLALVSAPKNNPYGHPHQEVVDLLKASNLPLYQTKDGGNLVAYSDGVHIWMKTQKKVQLQPNLKAA